RPFAASRPFHLRLRYGPGDRNYHQRSGITDPQSALSFGEKHLPHAVCSWLLFLPFLPPLIPPNSQLALGVAAFHTPGLVDGGFIVIMPEHELSDGFVHVAQTMRRAIVNDKFVIEFLEAELIPHSLPLLRPLQSMRERVVNLRLQFQKLA